MRYFADFCLSPDLYSRSFERLFPSNSSRSNFASRKLMLSDRFTPDSLQSGDTMMRGRYTTQSRHSIYVLLAHVDPFGRIAIAGYSGHQVLVG